MTLKYIWRSFQPRLSFPRPFQQSLACFRVARSPSNSWASCLKSSSPIFMKFGMDVQHLLQMSLLTCKRSRSRSEPPYWKSSTCNSSAVVISWLSSSNLAIRVQCPGFSTMKAYCQDTCRPSVDPQLSSKTQPILAPNSVQLAHHRWCKADSSKSVRFE